MLRMDGPLGLSGKAVILVITYTFEQADPESTKLIVTVNGSGEIEEGTSEIVKSFFS